MPVSPRRSTATLAMLARFSNSSLSITPICTASKRRTEESSSAFRYASANRSKIEPKMRPVRSTLVSPTAATYTSLAIAAKDNLRFPAPTAHEQVSRSEPQTSEVHQEGKMKRFRRVLLVLLVLIAIGWWLSPKGPAIEQDSVLVVDLEGAYVESAEPPLFARLTSQPPRPLAALLSELAVAERDTRLAAVVLRVRSLEIGWGKAQEIRSAIERLGERGRRTIAYLEIDAFGGNLEYYVASAAQGLFVFQGTRAPLVGLACEFLFFGGLFEKLGIAREVERVGAYKSAAETFAGRQMSDANREMETALIDSLDEQFVSVIARSRRLTPEGVGAAIDAAPSDP